jgi:hypothetical protein
MFSRKILETEGLQECFQGNFCERRAYRNVFKENFANGGLTGIFSRKLLQTEGLQEGFQGNFCKRRAYRNVFKENFANGRLT